MPVAPHQGTAPSLHGSDTRESSIFEPPEYKITYGSDQTLQWDPPTGSRELALALSYHFPLESDLESKMRAATRKFLRDERKNASKSTLNPVSESGTTQKLKSLLSRSPVQKPEPQVSKAIPQHIGGIEKDSSFRILNWSPDVKSYGVIKKRFRRRLDQDEAAEVAANRGHACEKHRRNKMKCDRRTCPQNGHNLKRTTAAVRSSPNCRSIPSDPNLIQLMNNWIPENHSSAQSETMASDFSEFWDSGSKLEQEIVSPGVFSTNAIYNNHFNQSDSPSTVNSSSGTRSNISGSTFNSNHVDPLLASSQTLSEISSPKLALSPARPSEHQASYQIPLGRSNASTPLPVYDDGEPFSFNLQKGDPAWESWMNDDFGLSTVEFDCSLFDVNQTAILPPFTQHFDLDTPKPQPPYSPRPSSSIRRFRKHASNPANDFANHILKQQEPRETDTSMSVKNDNPDYLIGGAERVEAGGSRSSSLSPSNHKYSQYCQSSPPIPRSIALEPCRGGFQSLPSCSVAIPNLMAAAPAAAPKKNATPDRKQISIKSPIQALRSSAPAPPPPAPPLPTLYKEDLPKSLVFGASGNIGSEQEGVTPRTEYRLRSSIGSAERSLETGSEQRAQTPKAWKRMSKAINIVRPISQPWRGASLRDESNYQNAEMVKNCTRPSTTSAGSLRNDANHVPLKQEEIGEKCSPEMDNRQKVKDENELEIEFQSLIIGGL